MARRRTVEDLSFKATADGDLELDGYEEGDEFEDPFAEAEEDEEEAEDDDSEAEDEEEEEEEDDDEVETKSSKKSDSDARLSRVESLLEKLMLTLATGDKPGNKQAVEDDEDDEEEIPDELDNKTMIKLLSKRIDKSVGKRFDQEMSKHTPALEQANLNSQFQKYAATFGQKFVDNIPAVARIMLKGDIKDVGKAWEIFQTLNPGGKKTNKVSAEKTVAKLRRKEVDADVRGSVGEMRNLPNRTPFQKLKGSDGDIFEKAFNSALIDATRRGRRR